MTLMPEAAIAREAGLDYACLAIVVNDAAGRGDTPIHDAVDANTAAARNATMSTLEAFEVGLQAEQKAHDFYDGALAGITDEDVRELFVELRDEEIEHVEMLRDAMGKLPSSAGEKAEFDLDEMPYL